MRVARRDEGRWKKKEDNENYFMNEDEHDSGFTNNFFRYVFSLHFFTHLHPLTAHFIPLHHNLTLVHAPLSHTHSQYRLNRQPPFMTYPYTTGANGAIKTRLIIYSDGKKF